MFDINVPSILIAVLVIIATYCISKFVCQTRNKSFVFHGSTFTRPTTIPSNVFQSSVHAMKLGIQRNLYAHWKPTSNCKTRPGCLHEMSRHKISECFDCHKRAISKSKIAAEKTFKTRNLDEDAQDIDHMSVVHACGVTVDWLLAFTFDHDCWNRPTWWVNRHIIKEATRTSRCRYMHLPEMKKYADSSEVFVSHSWGSKWGDVVLASCHGAHRDRVVWLDLFAVRQWPGSKADLHFRSVIERCDALIVSMSPVEGLAKYIQNYHDKMAFLESDEGIAAQKIIPVFRLWCNVEIAAAVEQRISIVVKSGRAIKIRGDDDNEQDETYSYDTNCVGDLLVNLQYMVDVESSKCLEAADKTRELSIIRKLDGGVEHVNASVFGILCGGTRNHNVMEIDSYVCGEPGALRQLIMNTCSIGKERELCKNILKTACAGGREKLVIELLDKWCSTGGKKADMWLEILIKDSKVLWHASHSGHSGLVKILLEVKGIIPSIGIDINSSNKNGGAPLYQACSNGHLDVVDLLLEEDDILINQTHLKHGSTPLLKACENGHTDIVKRLLLISNIDVNLACTAEKYNGYSPLRIALEKGYSEIVTLLTAAGAE